MGRPVSTRRLEGNAIMTMSKPPVLEAPIQGGSLLASIDDFLAADLAEVEQILWRELESDQPCVKDILQHATRFRGKRLRPILVLLSARACGEVTDAHKLLAAVVEMIHIATLVHDDVLDEASTRRHVATVNARWNNETSVLFGDYLFTHAFHLASELPTSHACRVIGRATNKVCEGELTQIHERGNLDLSEETYFRIINGKTAELTAVSAHIGAHYAGQPADVVANIEAYGRKLGVAFQIADDLLDLVGVEKKTGKTLGSDLQKQKLTLPIIRLLNTASSTDASPIRELLAHPDADTRSELAVYLRQSDALEYTATTARRLVDEACEHLEVLPESPVRQLLADIARFSVERSF
jgi:octaprenyl-diphosphate synthase